MDVFITYKDELAPSWIPGVKEYAHNSQMRSLSLTTESRVFIFNFDMIRSAEIADEGENINMPTL